MLFNNIAELVLTALLHTFITHLYSRFICIVQVKVRKKSNGDALALEVIYRKYVPRSANIQTAYRIMFLYAHQQL